MPNPLVPIVIWGKEYQGACWYDGTNLQAVRDFMGDGGYVYVSQNPVTKVITWQGTQTHSVPFIYQPINTWMISGTPSNLLNDADFLAQFVKGPLMGFYDVIHRIEIGNVKLPVLAIGVPSANQVVSLSGDMGSTDYSIKLIPGSTLLGSSTVNIVSKTSTAVTLTVTATGLISAGATLTLVCVN